MITAAAIYKALVAVSAHIPLREVCVLMGPLFSGNTVRSTAGQGAGGT